MKLNKALIGAAILSTSLTNLDLQPAAAITIRNDVDIQEYRNFGTEFPFAGSLIQTAWSPQNPDAKAGICSGSLIHRQWVLTAAHCLYSSGEPTTRASFYLDGVRYPIIAGIHTRFYDPSDSPFIRSNFDIGLYRLRGNGISLNANDMPVYGTPNNINFGLLDGAAAVVGYGLQGYGQDEPGKPAGRIEGSSNRNDRRAGINRIEASGNKLLYDFDTQFCTVNGILCITNGNLNNSDNSPIPTFLEAMPTSGDSGGPVVVGKNVRSQVFGNRHIVVGVHSNSGIRKSRLQEFERPKGAYGTQGEAVEVSAYAGWITNVISQFKRPAYNSLKNRAPGNEIPITTGGNNDFFDQETILSDEFEFQFELTEDIFNYNFDEELYNNIFADPLGVLANTPAPVGTIDESNNSNPESVPEPGAAAVLLLFGTAGWIWKER